MEHDPLHPETEGPSKSQRKRDARALFDLGRELTRLSRSELGRLPLDPAIREAVDEARRITAHVAHKRQLQFLARLLRGADIEPLREAMEQVQGEARQLTARQHRVEYWRDRLLEDGDSALGALLAAVPGADGQALRQLVRNAAREAERGQAPTAARKLFRLLREIDSNTPLPSD